MEYFIGGTSTHSTLPGEFPTTNSSVLPYTRPRSTPCAVGIAMRAESADCELPDKPDDSKNTEEMLQQYSRATGINGRSFYWRPIVTTQTLLGIEIAISRLSSNTSREVSNHTNFASSLKLLPCRKQGAVSSYSWGGRVGSLLAFQVLG